MRKLQLLAVLATATVFCVGVRDAGGQQQQSQEGARRPLFGEQAPHPPAVGNEAPDFELKNLKGKTLSLKELSKDHTVVLLVLRGWPGYQCPICTRQVGEFLQKKKEFADLGVEVVMIYPGPADLLAEHAKEFQGEEIFPDHFHYVMDPDYVFTNAWGLRWDAAGETAYPSTFIVAKNGKVSFAETSTSHGGRVGADTVLKELAKLKE